MGKGRFRTICIRVYPIYRMRKSFRSMQILTAIIEILFYHLKMMLKPNYGMDKAEISRIENGEQTPRLDRVLRMADALGMKLALVPKDVVIGYGKEDIMKSQQDLINRQQAYIERLEKNSEMSGQGEAE